MEATPGHWCLGRMAERWLYWFLFFFFGCDVGWPQTVLLWFQCKINSAAAKKNRQTEKQVDKWCNHGTRADVSERLWIQSFRSLTVRKRKYRVKLIDLERICITYMDPLWWTSGIRSSFSRYSIPKLELNIDHLINIDLFIVPWGVFGKRIFLFLRLSSHPSIYRFIPCGAAGKWEVTDKSSPYSALSSNWEKKKRKRKTPRQTVSCCCSFRTTNIVLSALQEEKFSPKLIDGEMMPLSSSRRVSGGKCDILSSNPGH